ncbi:DUF6022 family protein [Paenibacillus sp. GbtcB18]|uniref:DUF6022 family protein n=1 Tax=Paenibacillus sp. GbtcB18 TaxID=2824763 RepID=UPI001C30D00E|nr:DUF6022 family protein [Paenibacillus sp. GbtcB18]
MTKNSCYSAYLLTKSAMLQLFKAADYSGGLEKWGTEDNKSRIFWNVIRDRQDNPAGTLLTEIPHSHLKFDIPSAPVVYVLPEFLKEKIVQGVRGIKELTSLS